MPPIPQGSLLCEPWLPEAAGPEEVNRGSRIPLSLPALRVSAFPTQPPRETLRLRPPGSKGRSPRSAATRAPALSCALGCPPSPRPTSLTFTPGQGCLPARVARLPPRRLRPGPQVSTHPREEGVWQTEPGPLVRVGLSLPQQLGPPAGRLRSSRRGSSPPMKTPSPPPARRTARPQSLLLRSLVPPGLSVQGAAETFLEGCQTPARPPARGNRSLCRRPVEPVQAQGPAPAAPRRPRQPPRLRWPRDRKGPVPWAPKWAGQPFCPQGEPGGREGATLPIAPYPRSKHLPRSK